jgi:hypothetical protein
MRRSRGFKGTTMTTLAAYDTTRFDRLFAAIIAFCADFCGGARQGGYPPSPATAPAAQRR